jgi:hypothetical protein
MLNDWRAQFARWYREPQVQLHFEDTDSKPFVMQPVSG